MSVNEYNINIDENEGIIRYWCSSKIDCLEITKELSQILEEKKEKSCLTCRFEPQNIDEKRPINSYCNNHSEWQSKKKVLNKI